MGKKNLSSDPLWSLWCSHKVPYGQNQNDHCLCGRLNRLELWESVVALVK